VKPAPFEYVTPSSLTEAHDALTEDGCEAKLLAGGQSLIPLLAMRLSRFDRLVDLRLLDELQGVEAVIGSLRVGAMTLQADVEANPATAAAAPLLAMALPHIGHFQIRNRGTIGGSIAHADPAAELPAVALATDAVLDISGPAGKRSVPAAEFFESTFMTAIDDAEILTAISFPVWGDNAGFAVEEVARRHGDFAIVGTACGVQLDDGQVSRAAVALFGAGPTPVRCGAAEAALVGADTAGIDLDEIGELAAGDTEPPDDVHASSRYRKHVAAKLVSKGLARALGEATSG
jgi:carbon-monoxide dehydrogenase medium subunit